MGAAEKLSLYMSYNTVRLRRQKVVNRAMISPQSHVEFTGLTASAASCGYATNIWRGSLKCAAVSELATFATVCLGRDEVSC